MKKWLMPIVLMSFLSMSMLIGCSDSHYRHPSSTDVSTPSAPGSVNLTSGNTQLTVTWDAVTGATSYEVYYGTSNDIGAAARFEGDADDTDTTCIITPLDNDTLYYVWVIAKNSAGSSNASSVTTGQPVSASWPGTAQFGSADGFDSAEGFALDANGNIYVGGYTYGSFPGFAREGTDGDTTIVKLDSSGAIVQSYQSQAANDDHIFGVAVDGENNLIVTGYRYNDADDVISFLRKYDSSLTLLWSQELPVTDARAYAVTVDGSNNIYAAGDSYGSFGDAFVVKYDKDGNHQWTRIVGTATWEQDIKGVAADANGYVYITGTTMGTFPGNTPAQEYDAFVAKVSQADGTLAAVRQFGSTLNDYGRRIVVDSTRNVVWVVGTTLGSFAAASAGGSDVFIAKLGTDTLDLQDSEQFGTGASDEGYGIDLDASGNVYAGGWVFGPLDGEAFAGGSDGFLIKYDPDGTRLWTREFGSASNENVKGVKVAGGYVYVTGYTYGAWDGSSQLGEGDQYVVKYSGAGDRQ